MEHASDDMAFLALIKVIVRDMVMVPSEVALQIIGWFANFFDWLTRKLLFAATTLTLYRTPPSIALKQSGLRLNARSGCWKARVALARKLAVTLL